VRLSELTDAEKDDLRDQITELRDEGLRREEIAAELECSIHTLKRLIADLKIPRKPAKRGKKKKKSGALILRPPDCRTVLDRARGVLGERVGELKGVGYTLDGKPCNTDRIVAAAGLTFADE